MDDQQTRYALLRYQQSWDGVTTAHLQAMPDGVLTLARVPGPADGKAIPIPGPYDLPPSGLAVGEYDDLYIAATATDRLVWVDGICGSRMLLPAHHGSSAAPGHFNAPAGLLIVPPATLYVADSGNSRIQILRLPTLEVRAIWEGPLQTPTALAIDSQERIYVLDRGLKQVLRFNPWGIADDAYNMVMATPPGMASPAFLAITADDVLYVSDDVTDTIFCYNTQGQPLAPLPPATGSPFRPRALVAAGERLYVADAASGAIWVYDWKVGQYVGMVAGYQGPVTALAVNQAGTLFIKSGLDEALYTLAVDAAFVASGELVSVQLDAGERSDWTRVVADTLLPTGTRIQLQLFASDDAAAVPASTDWSTSDTLDTLVPPFTPPGNAQPGRRRYLWLRLLLTSDQPAVSPELRQVQAETAGEEYMRYLPPLYRREDAEHGFLQRWLALFRGQLSDLERTLDDMPQRFHPEVTPVDHLEWLASWLAFELPLGWEHEALRALLLRVHDLYPRRGTRFGVSEFVELYTGVRPQIIEAFQERRFWLLDQTSVLGFDTGLATLDAQGIVVPDSSAPPPLTEPAGATSTEAWTRPPGLVVGEVVVGQIGPLAAADWGEPLFSQTAHRFTLLVPAAQALHPQQRQALGAIIEAEKPAHTDYHLCFVEARMRVGLQARIGIDSIIAGPLEPMALDGATLGFDSTLGEDEGEEGISRIGQLSRLGHDLVIT